MTFAGARDTAAAAAIRFGKPFAVYRLPAWPAGVYACTAQELPAQAEILERHPLAGTPEAIALAEAEQGSLF